jgi:hypothetical protein
MSKFKIRDDTIINIIKDILKKVEGPASYCLLKPTDKMKDILGHRPSIIILFGDIHYGDKKCLECKEEDGCLSFYGGNPTIHNFFSYMSRIAHVDVFLETWYTKVDRELGRIKSKSSKTHNSALVEFKKFSSPCFNLKDKKDCQVKDYYIHMSDPRYSNDPKNIDGIFEIIATYDLPSFKLQIELILTDKEGNHPDYREVIILCIQALELGTKEFMNKVFRYNPIIQKFSKTYKQLSKLPEKLQDLIYNKYFDTLTSLKQIGNYTVNRSDISKCMQPQKMSFDFNYTKFKYPSHNKDIVIYEDDSGRGDIPAEVFYEGLKEILKTYSRPKKQQTDKDKSFCSLIGLDTGLDFYYLGRTFKKSYNEQKEEKVSEISVGYFGANHVNNIMEFLVRNGLYTLEDKYILDDSKCLRLA